MSDDSYPGAGWMNRWRMATAVRSLLGSNRFQNLTPVDDQVVGLVPARGVLICDPGEAEPDWAIGPATAGPLQDTPSAIGVTPDGLFQISIRRGGGSGTEGRSRRPRLPSRAATPTTPKFSRLSTAYGEWPSGNGST